MEVTSLGHGMTRYSVEDGRDQTTVTLLRFDLRAARLSFGIYDADEDDATPNDGHASELRNALWVYNHIKDRGLVLAVVNGPLFRDPGAHAGPLVRRGRIASDMATSRWTLAEKETDEGPEFTLLHRPDRKQLARYDWAGGNVQALVVDGRPTRIPPPSETVPEPTSPPSRKEDCGPCPYADYLKTARTSIGWKKFQFALLIVSQGPFDDEKSSLTLRARGRHQRSGWDLVDLQRFWLAWGARGACNLDGGLSTQLAYLDVKGVRYRASNGNADAVDDKSGPGHSAPVLLFPYVVKR
jgi:hypothetical protein